MKDFLNQFDLDNAFKALDELEYPTVKGGIRPNRIDLHEHFTRKPKTDLLIEEYYNVGSDADLEAAQDQREEEVAQAKLDRIEKIVDLDADTEEDLQAAYVGKFVIQCPQCMTLFYKKPEDVNVSEEDSSLANVGELCPNCSNDSGFTVVGKIEDATPEPAAEEAPIEGEETGVEETPVEEVPAEREEGEEEDLDLDFDLGDMDLGIEETEEQEPAEESLNLSKALQDASKKTELDTENHSENLTLNESNDQECKDGECCKDGKCDESLNNSEAQKDASENTELDTENHSENLTLNEEIPAEIAMKTPTNQIVKVPVKDGMVEIEDKDGKKINLKVEEALHLTEGADIKKELKAYNEYIEYLQKQIEADEEAIKTATNDFVKDSIQRRIDANKADLDSAMPEILKSATEEAPVEELDVAEETVSEETTEEAPVEEAPVEEAEVAEETEVQEALNEACEGKDCNKKYIVRLNFGKLGGENPIYEQRFATPEEAVAYLEDSYDNWYFDDLDTAETVIYPALCDAREGEWEELDDGTFLIADSYLDDDSVNEACKGKDCKEDVNILSGNSSSIDLGDAGAAIGAALPLLADDEGEKRGIEEDFWGDKRKGKFHRCPDIVWADDEKTIVYNGRKLDGDAVESELWGIYIEKTNTPNEDFNDPKVAYEFDKFVCTDGKKFLDNVLADEQKYAYLIKESVNEGEKAITEAESAEEATLDKLYDSKEFRTPVSQSVIDNFFSESVDEVEIKDIEELDDNSLTETVTKYLKEVYDNVNSFSLTGCQFNEGTSQLLIKGDINFTSGKTKPTTFAFNPCGNRFFEGYNFDLCDTKAFRLYGKMKDKTFFTEGIRYSYHIQDNLVEGLVRN